MHERDRADIVQPHLLRQRHARGLIRVDADDENVGLLGGELQEPEMPGVDDVEVAGDERHALVRVGRGANQIADMVTVGGVDQLVQGSGLRQIEAAKAPKNHAVLPVTESSVVLNARGPKIAAASRNPANHLDSANIAEIVESWLIEFKKICGMLLAGASKVIRVRSDRSPVGERDGRNGCDEDER